MSEPIEHIRLPGGGNGEARLSIHFHAGSNLYGLVIHGNPQRDLIVSSSTAPAAATSAAARNTSNEGVRDRGPNGPNATNTTGRSTRNPGANQAGSPPQSSSDDSIPLPSIVPDEFSFGDARGTGGGAQNSIRSTCTQTPEVNYTDCSPGAALTPIEDPSTVSELAIPPITQRSMGMASSDLDVQSTNGSRPTIYTECRGQGSTVAETSGHPTLDEFAVPPPIKPEGRIHKVEHFFRALPKMAKKSLVRLINLSSSR